MLMGLRNGLLIVVVVVFFLGKKKKESLKFSSSLFVIHVNLLFPFLTILVPLY